MLPELRGDSDPGSEGQSHPKPHFRHEHCSGRGRRSVLVLWAGTGGWICAPASEESPWPGALPKGPLAGPFHPSSAVVSSSFLEFYHLSWGEGRDVLWLSLKDMVLQAEPSSVALFLLLVLLESALGCEF